MNLFEIIDAWVKEEGLSGCRVLPRSHNFNQGIFGYIDVDNEIACTMAIYGDHIRFGRNTVADLYEIDTIYAADPEFFEKLKSLMS